MSHKIEREFIGGLIIYPSHLAEYVEAVDRRWFGDHTHRLLWGALLALRARGEEVDVLTVAAEARRAELRPGRYPLRLQGSPLQHTSGTTSGRSAKRRSPVEPPILPIGFGTLRPLRAATSSTCWRGRVSKSGNLN